MHPISSPDTWLEHDCSKGILEEVITELKSNGIRVSLFIDADSALIEGAAKAGAERIEYYTDLMPSIIRPIRMSPLSK